MNTRELPGKVDFYAKYERTSAELNSKIDSLIQQKRELKRALKSGRMDNVTYQKTLTPLKERIWDLEYEISNLRYEGVMEAFPDVPDITFDVIECYVLNKRNGQNSTDA